MQPEQQLSHFSQSNSSFELANDSVIWNFIQTTANSIPTQQYGENSRVPKRRFFRRPKARCRIFQNVNEGWPKNPTLQVPAIIPSARTEILPACRIRIFTLSRSNPRERLVFTRAKQYHRRFHKYIRHQFDYVNILNYRISTTRKVSAFQRLYECTQNFHHQIYLQPARKCGTRYANPNSLTCSVLNRVEIYG